jgi:phosphoketolase
MSRIYNPSKPEIKSEASSSASAGKSNTIYSEMEALKKELFDLKLNNEKLFSDNEKQYALIQELNMEICDWSTLYEKRGLLLKELRKQLETESEKKE